MADYNINLTLSNIWSIIRILIDIGILWFILYYAIKFVRNNLRTVQIFKGIVIVLIVNGLSRLFGLATVEYISNQIISWGFLAIIIIFQPEIRGVLERIGKSNAFSRTSTLLANEKEDLVEKVYEATINLSKAKVGALITIEQSQSLQDYIKTGISLNAEVTKELLCSLFMTTTPLHDGAVIIQGKKIVCASAYFPPTSINLSSRYGARHRAALGISEVSDALTIVVSEETSAISIADHGSIFNVDEKQLKDYLKRIICNDEIEIREETQKRNSLTIVDEPEVVIEKEETKGSTLKSIFIRKNENKKEDKNEENKEPDMKIPFNNRNKNENNTLDIEVEKINDDDVQEAIEIKDNTSSENKEDK